MKQSSGLAFKQKTLLLGSACINDKCVEACEEGWDARHGNHCYLWSNNQPTWIAAENFCQEQGGHLASDMEKEGVWIWTDCTPWEFTFWGPGKPKEGNREILSKSPKWPIEAKSSGGVVGCFS